MLLPDATSEARRFVDIVAAEMAARRARIALCGTDAELWALSRWRERLPESARRILPPHDAVARVLDRGALHDLARSLHIPCLDLVRIDSAANLEPRLRESARRGFPAHVSPIVAWEEREDGARGETERILVRNIAELRRLLYSREDFVTPGCVVEPRPRGTYLGYGVICDGGSPIVEIFRERLRERSALSGVSTLSRTVAPDPELRELGRKLLRALSWHGPAMVECLRTRDGVLRLVSVVGRMWGSVQLGVNAGVDVPLICYRMAEGSPLPTTMRLAKPGHTLRWWVGDVEQAVQRVSGKSDRVGWIDRARAVAEVMDPRALWRAHGDVFDPADPLPFAYEVRGMVQASSQAKS